MSFPFEFATEESFSSDSCYSSLVLLIMFSLGKSNVENVSSLVIHRIIFVYSLNDI